MEPDWRTRERKRRSGRRRVVCEAFPAATVVDSAVATGGRQVRLELEEKRRRKRERKGKKEGRRKKGARALFLCIGCDPFPMRAGRTHIFFFFKLTEKLKCTPPNLLNNVPVVNNGIKKGRVGWAVKVKVYTPQTYSATSPLLAMKIKKGGIFFFFCYDEK